MLFLSHKQLLVISVAFLSCLQISAMKVVLPEIESIINSKEYQFLKDNIPTLQAKKDLSVQPMVNANDQGTIVRKQDTVRVYIDSPESKENVSEQPLEQCLTELQKNVDNICNTDAFSQALKFGINIDESYKKGIAEITGIVFAAIKKSYPKYSSEMQLRTYAQAFGTAGKKYIELGDAFHQNVLNNKFEVAKELLDQGVHVDFPYQMKDQGPCGDGEQFEGSFLVHLCLSRYNDPSAQVREQTVGQIEFLLLSGANPNVVIDDTKFLLHNLIINKYPVLVKLFLKYKANIFAAFLKDDFLCGQKGTAVLDMLLEGWIPEINVTKVLEYLGPMELARMTRKAEVLNKTKVDVEDTAQEKVEITTEFQGVYNK